MGLHEGWPEERSALRTGDAPITARIWECLCGPRTQSAWADMEPGTSEGMEVPTSITEKLEGELGKHG